MTVATPAPTTHPVIDRPSGGPGPRQPGASMRGRKPHQSRTASDRRDRVAHVFRTLGSGLVAEYGPG